MMRKDPDETYSLKEKLAVVAMIGEMLIVMELFCFIFLAMV